MSGSSGESLTTRERRDTSLEDFASRKLEQLSVQSMRRDLSETERSRGARVCRNGRELISFCCNDYLGLSKHPAVVAAAIAALERYGAGAGSSRLVTGNNPPISVLEADLAAYKRSEAAIVFGSGYLANMGVVPALVGRGDLIAMDELSHSCMHAAALLSGAYVRLFRHNEAQHADELLEASSSERKMILTETVFSMDGDLAPVDDLLDVARRNGAWLLTDDAHGLGIVASNPQVPLQMGTLSKAAGSYGGYLCASRPVIDLMKSRARTLVYSTGLPPASAAAATAALRIMSTDHRRCTLPLRYAERFCAALGLREPESAIVPIIVGDAARVMWLSDELAESGYLVTGIRPPTVPTGTARLRVTFSADHSPEDVEGLIWAFRALAVSKV